MEGLKQARAIICATFGAYRFVDVDEMTMEEVAELAGAARYLSEDYAQPKQRRRR